MSLRPRASASALDVASPGSVSSPGASSSSKPILSPLLSPSNLLRGGGGSGSSNGPHLSPSSPSGTARGLAHSPSLASLGSAGRGRQASAEYGSPGPWEEEREESLRELAVVLGALRQVEAHKLDGTLHLLSQLQRLVHEGDSLPPNHARPSPKDEFRRLGGYLTLVGLLSSLEGSRHPPQAESEDASAELAVLHLDEGETKADPSSGPTEAPADASSEARAEGSSAADDAAQLHERLRVEIFKLTLSVLLATLVSVPANTAHFERAVGWDTLLASLRLSTVLETSPRQFYGALLGLAVGDVGSWIGWLDRAKLDESGEAAADEEALLRRISQAWGSTRVEVPKGLSLVVSCLADCGDRWLDTAVSSILERIAQSSRRNQVAMAQAGLGDQLLEPASSQGDSAATACKWRTAQRLCELGLSNATAQTMLRRLISKSDVSLATDSHLGLLLSIAAPSRGPKSVTFEMGTTGHASLSFSSLRRPFPPGTNSRGFSFFASIYIERIEPSAELELLQLFDVSRQCSVRLSIEPGTGQVNYSTAEGAPRTHFQGAVQAGAWTHICLTHARPKAQARSSLAQLFLNGRLVDEQTVLWPSSASGNVRAVFGTMPPARVSPTTPQSARRKASRLVWSLGPAHLLDAVVPPDLPLVLSELSPRYAGNLQDSLGRFLTYSTSTHVNLRLSELSRNGTTGSGSERDLSSHPLVAAIAGSARDLFNEERFYFVVSADNTWALARQAVAADAAIRPGPLVVLNQAMPLTRDAIAAPSGYAKLYGDPVLCVPKGLDETIWQLGGAGVLLALVERASDAVGLERALALLFSVTKDSWRLSEDLERKKGYEVLSLLLHRHQERGLLSRRILDMFLEAVGVENAQPEETALSNPFLFRLFLLDFQLWTRCDDDTQRVHLQHFGTLLRISRHRRFNIRRSGKMQLARKMLYALRANVFSEETLEEAIQALRVVLIASFSEANIRALTTYLASQLCQAVEEARSPAPQRMSTLDSSSAGAVRASTGASASSTPLRVFEMLTELVLERPSYLSKLATSVSSKWLLLFFHPHAERRAAVLSLAILSRLLATLPRYAERLNAAGGIKTLERLLPRFWSSPAVLPTCFAILFGKDLEPGAGLSSFEPAPALQVRCAPIMRVIVATMREGLRATASRGAPSRTRPGANRGRPSDFLAAPTPSAKGRHGRKRSASFNIDSKELAESFKTSSEEALLRDAVSLLEKHCLASAVFRELLFSPIILRLLVSTVSPYARVRGRAKQDDAASGEDELDLVDTLCDRIFTLLAQLALESMLETGGTAVLAALVAAAPPADLKAASSFRAAMFARLCEAAVHMLARRPAILRSDATCGVLATLAASASEEALQGSPLLHSTFDLITALLNKLTMRARQPQDAVHTVIRSLLASLNQVVLLRLATEEASVCQTLRQVAQQQTSVFASDNSDETFFRCLLHQALKHLKDKDRQTSLESRDVLRLLVVARPPLFDALQRPGSNASDLLKGSEPSYVCSLVQGLDSDTAAVPYEQEWDGFLKSLETLKAAAHLERIGHVKELLDRSDARDHAIVATERRMVAWHASLRSDDEVRYNKYRLDARELFVFAQAEWTKMLASLQRERGLLGPDGRDGSRMWKLDPTEGPQRMRIKLQELPRAEEAAEVPYIKGAALQHTSDEKAHGDEWGSGEQLVDEPEEALVPDNTPHPETPGHGKEASTDPTETGLPEAARDETDAAELGDGEEKFRRVLRSLERGDVIVDVYNTSRVVGIECRAALLIVGRTCLTLIDDYVQLRSGELCAAWEAPREERDALVMATVASEADADRPSTLIATLEGEAQTRKWPWAQLVACHRRAFLHRRTAVELFFQDGQSCLLVLDKTATVERLLKELGTRNRAAVVAPDSLLAGIRLAAPAARAQGGGSLSSRLAGAVLGRSQQPGALTAAWMRREISNFDYLMQLNTLAGRTYTDLSAYPVFPWILADYTSATLDLSNPSTFRKLELPMGAQMPARRRQFDERYAQLLELDEVPRHYGTHYSTAATVCGYLIRVRPYSAMLIALQGGTFDLADRTFSSIQRAWQSASELSSGDVRELVPEMFFLPECLVNTNRFDFGHKQDGEAVDDVELPPWAHGDARLFIQKHREALESDYVSAHLGSWIDLIFGCRSRGEGAVESTNVFHPLSYDDGVDLEAIESPHERLAAASQIHNFGQCMPQLFTQPHPARAPRIDASALPGGQLPSLSETPWLMAQAIVPIRTLRGSVHSIYAERPERAYASPRDYLIMPKLGLSISSGHLDGSVRIFGSHDAGRAAGVTEQMTAARITCMQQAGPDSIVVGSSDGLLGLWKVNASKAELSLSSTLRAHSASVLCVVASMSYSIVVSGSEDCTAAVWDLNRGEYVRSLRGHASAVQQVAVDGGSGLIATAAGPEVRLWSINGDLLSRISTNASLSEPVASLAFFAREWHEGKLALLLTGHRRKVIAWACTPRSSDEQSRLLWRLEPHHVFEHHDRVGPATTPLITAIHTSATQLFTGDELGRLYVWSFPGDAIPVPDSYSGSCMGPCAKRFGVLEAKRTCVSCGGLFCSACAQPQAVYGGARFCQSCSSVLALLPTHRP